MKKIFSILIVTIFCLGSAHAVDRGAPIEETLAIIKPDAVQRSLIGPIISMYEEAGLHVIAAEMLQLTKDRAGLFYREHKDRTFFKELVDYMTSGPIFVMVLEGPGAIEKNRELMGKTNPSEAKKGTIRALYGTDVQRNAVHGSDSQKSAEREITFFFSETEIYPRVYTQ